MLFVATQYSMYTTMFIKICMKFVTWTLWNLSHVYDVYEV